MKPIVTGNPAWATFDTNPAAPKWTFKSVDNKDAAVFTIKQVATLNNRREGVLLSTF